MALSRCNAYRFGTNSTALDEKNEEVRESETPLRGFQSGASVAFCSSVVILEWSLMVKRRTKSLYVRWTRDRGEYAKKIQKSLGWLRDVRVAAIH